MSESDEVCSSHPTLPFEIFTVEIAKYISITILRKLAITSKAFDVSTLVERAIKSLSVCSDVSEAFLWRYKDKLRLTELTFDQLVRLPTGASNWVDFVAQTLRSQSNLQSLALLSKPKVPVKISWRWLFPQESLTSLNISGTFAPLASLETIVETYPKLKRLNLSSQPSSYAVLQKLTDLEFLSVPIKFNQLHQIQSLSRLTTLMTAEPEMRFSTDHDIDMAIANVKSITPQGVGINVIFSSGTPLLWRLISQPKPERLPQLKMLLESGARVSLGSDSNADPLMVEFVRNCYKIGDSFEEWLDTLLLAGADPSLPSPRSGLNALLTALDTINHEDTLMLFYRKSLAIWKDRVVFDRLFRHSTEGLSIFHILAMIEKSSKRDPNGVTTRLRQFFLSPEGLKLLGTSDIDLRDNYGRTPAFVTVSPFALEDFLEAGANPNAKNSYGTSLLAYKAASGATESTRIVLSRKDVLLPDPRRDKGFQDIFIASYVLQIKEKYQKLVDLASWSQLMKLLDNIIKDIRFSHKHKSEVFKLFWRLEALLVASQSAQEKNDQSINDQHAIYLWDIFDTGLQDPKLYKAIHCLLRSGVPVSWGNPGDPPRRRGNVLIHACEHKAYDIIPIILEAHPQLASLTDHTEKSSAEYFCKLVEQDGAPDAKKIQSCLEAFCAAGLDLSDKIINLNP